MTTVLGLDLSLSATGLAKWHNGAVRVYTIRTAPPPHNHNGWAQAYRHRLIARELVRHIEPGATVVAKEARLDSIDVPGNSMLDMAAVHAVVDYVLAAQGVPIAHVNLVYPKGYATGNARASKEDMVAAARMRLGAHVECFNHNEADALWLLAMAMQHYGAPLCPADPKQVGKLDRITWPLLPATLVHNKERTHA